jgi:hypothetical protein
MTSERARLPLPGDVGDVGDVGEALVAYLRLRRRNDSPACF